MNKITYILVTIFLSIIIYGQNVTLSKISNSKDNKDKILYKLHEEKSSSEYLGEIEVQGFSHDPVETFSKIYKKAKQIGANSFSLKISENIDGTPNTNFNEEHFFLNLYYTPKENLPKENNTIYIVASEKKSQVISINNKKTEFPPRTFCKIQMNPGEIYTISTRKLLGSTIKVSTSPNQEAQYFQISSFKISQNPYGNAGINLKSGDIISLERSFAEFLTIIYKEFHAQ